MAISWVKATPDKAEMPRRPVMKALENILGLKAKEKEAICKSEKAMCSDSTKSPSNYSGMDGLISTLFVPRHPQTSLASRHG